MAVFKLKVFPSAFELHQQMAACLEKTLQHQGDEPFAVMLSGGKTPLDSYEMLRRRGIRAAATAHILYSDERDVPVFSEENNYHHTVGLLQSLGIPDSRIMRVRTGQPLEMAATQYDRELQRFLTAGGRITLGVLGIGADGHTASLFSPADIERGHGCNAVAVPHDPKPDRISVTPGFLARVERLIILAAGPGKREIISKLMKNPEDVVAGLALRNASQAEIWQA